MAKGIMFTEVMFNAVIEGRKTQTRRVIKPKPGSELFYVKKLNKNEWVESDKYTGYYSCVKNGRFYTPNYKIGEKVYLKEPYLVPVNCFGQEFEDRGIEYVYGDTYTPSIGFVKKNPSTMAAKYASYFIEITGVRCEMLQDISDEDCLKEGIFGYPSNDLKSGFPVWAYGDKSLAYNTPKQAYAALINKINGKGTWESNPYVWVYDFKLINNQ
ncbi:MAG: hypothetical protein FWD60_11070 [Candidatus Azobacteroides sp.]|nr:hypothetical protein [Candidatus Azobacteroides sp.]